MLRQNQSSVGFFLSQFFFPSTSKRHDAHAEGEKNDAIISQRGTICRLSLMYTSRDLWWNSLSCHENQTNYKTHSWTSKVFFINMIHML